MKHIFFTLFFLILIKAYSQSPQAFNYQAIARDSVGNPIANTNIGVQVSILEDATNGTVVYAETWTPKTNNSGLFTIAIGNGEQISGGISIIPWSTHTFYLKIEIDVTGGSNYTLSGISQILSVPYALYAANGTQWTGAKGSNLYYNSGYISLGYVPESPQRPITITDTLAIIRLNRIDNAYFAGIDYVPTGNPSSTNVSWTAGLTPNSNSFNIYNWIEGVNLSNSNYVFSITNSGNVGIGTTTPTSALEVANGDIKIDSIGSGIIMKSPSGSCFRITINNAGTLTPTAITCP